MKILLISLLRLGDILLATSVLRSLKRKYPHAELHILINGQFQGVSPLVPYVSKVYAFDREGLQSIIGSEERNLLEAYYRVEDLVERLQTENYDQVVNLTHNRLSGWLTALVGCSQTKGVVFNSNGKFSLGSNWFQFLNDYTEPGLPHSFHFVDVFHYGTGVEYSNRQIELNETSHGAKFAEEVLNKNKKWNHILIQTGSSEKKKTLSEKKWSELILLLQKSEPLSDIYILGSSQEKQTLERIIIGTNAQAVVCNLEEVYSLLLRSQLLITPDTSIKHMASATNIKVVEISLGSSDYRRTGVYAHESVIIQSRAPCAPCNHSSACHRPTHECENQISHELIAMVSTALKRSDESALRMLAHEYSDEVSILKTFINNRGDWSALPLAQKFSATEINSWIERASFKLHLQKDYEMNVGELGSEGIELKRILENIFPDRSRQDWAQELKAIELDVRKLEEKFSSLLTQLKNVLGHWNDKKQFDSFVTELKSLREDIIKSGLFRSYAKQFDYAFAELSGQTNHFAAVKQLREKLTAVHQRSKIELKLVRGLQNEFMEII